MFGSMQRRWEMRRLQSRLEAARRRKEMAMEAFVSGKPASPMITSSSSWSRRLSEQPDAGHVAEAIEEFEALEAEVSARITAFEEAE
jgi:hypothetical protein